jgi:class I fructose-bisphosphate aldolase
MSEIYLNIQKILGEGADDLLNHTCNTIPKIQLHLPGPNFTQDIFSISDRSEKVMENLNKLFNHGRLSGTGYLSILPVDQGIEHSAGAAFSDNPMYFDPENIIKLAIEGGCNAVASSVGALGMVAKKYAGKIPFIVKLNHNDLLRYPNDYDQIMFGSVDEAVEMGAVGVGATIYFGSPESKRQIQEVSAAFHEAHEKGLFTVLWCYVRNEHFSVDGKNYETSADVTGQADYIGATIEADIVKQKLPTINRGFEKINAQGEKYEKFDEAMYSKLASDHPIDLCRYQVANGFMGRIGLINSGGEHGKNDLHDAVYSAVINKRAGGMGLILGRKAFQKPLDEGIKILNAVQDVYLCKEITVA